MADFNGTDTYWVPVRCQALAQRGTLLFNTLALQKRPPEADGCAQRLRVADHLPPVTERSNEAPLLPRIRPLSRELCRRGDPNSSASPVWACFRRIVCRQ